MTAESTRNVVGASRVWKPDGDTRRSGARFRRIEKKEDREIKIGRRTTEEIICCCYRVAIINGRTSQQMVHERYLLDQT